MTSSSSLWTPAEGDASVKPTQRCLTENETLHRVLIRDPFQRAPSDPKAYGE